ncbi:diguanylate cyclase [Undibacterium sp. TJN25]|uniref:GGDEF domain-containing protein n=1 Tax=Undibacterium sp. TJN25 TaxID=3413056 RepID=UPI003BF3E89E
MLNLDLRVVILLSSVVPVLMAIVLFSAYRSFPASIKGIGWWTLASVLLFAAAVLFGLRGRVPDLLSIVLGTAVMLGAVGCRLIGTQYFYGRPPALRLVLAIVLLGTGGAAWWSMVQPSFQFRMVLVAPLLAILYGIQLFTVTRYADRHFGSYFFGGMILLQTVLIVMRVATGLSGRQDYVNFYSGDLVQSAYLIVYNFMTMALAVGFMMVATRRLHAELMRMSNIDPLTDALNRRAFTDIYESEARRIKRNEQAMSLIIIDLDHFKRINDKYGHAVGDSVLVHFSSVVMRLLRETDHFARFGGEEFVVLLPETNAGEAQVVAERICTRLREADGTVVPSYTVSMGLAEVSSGIESLDAALGRADAALYRAKSAGRDRLEIAAPQKGIRMDCSEETALPAEEVRGSA